MGAKCLEIHSGPGTTWPRKPSVRDNVHRELLAWLPDGATPYTYFPGEFTDLRIRLGRKGAWDPANKDDVRLETDKLSCEDRMTFLLSFSPLVP